MAERGRLVKEHRLSPCKDGHVFFGSYTDKLWRESCAIFGEPQLGDDPEIDTMAKRFDEVVTDAHLRARQMFVQVPFGDVDVEVFGSPMKLSGTPPRTAGAVPQLGQHNREIYVDWLGIDGARFDALRSAGVI